MLPPLHTNKAASVKSSIVFSNNNGTKKSIKSKGGRESSATISYSTSDPMSRKAYHIVKELSEITQLVH